MKKIIQQVKKLVFILHKVSNPTNYIIKKMFPWFRVSKNESWFQLLELLLELSDSKNLIDQVMDEVKNLKLSLTANYTQFSNSFALFKGKEFYGIINVDNNSKISYSFSSINTLLKPCKDLATVFKILNDNYNFKSQKIQVISEFVSIRDVELEDLAEMLKDW